jgi:hypothetical protein
MEALIEKNQQDGDFFDEEKWKKNGFLLIPKDQPEIHKIRSSVAHLQRALVRSIKHSHDNHSLAAKQAEADKKYPYYNHLVTSKNEIIQKSHFLHSTQVEVLKGVENNILEGTEDNKFYPNFLLGVSWEIGEARKSFLSFLESDLLTADEYRIIIYYDILLKEYVNKLMERGLSGDGFDESKPSLRLHYYPQWHYDLIKNLELVYGHGPYADARHNLIIDPSQGLEMYNPHNPHNHLWEQPNPDYSILTRGKKFSDPEDTRMYHRVVMDASLKRTSFISGIISFNTG